MLRFKNLLANCHVYHPSGHPNSVLVTEGQVVEVAGEVVAEHDDCWVVAMDGDTRAWPKTNWELEPAPKPSPKKGSVSAEVADDTTTA